MKLGMILVSLIFFFALCPVMAKENSMSDMPMPKAGAVKTLPKTNLKTETGLPKISISKKTEEGKDMLVATVTLNGKPFANVKIEFFVERTFGHLSLGTDDTLDDGTAAVDFPMKLPGNAMGKLKILARIKEPKQYASAQTEADVAAAEKITPEENPFPRALWSSRPPLALVLTIVLLLCGVWTTYSYVIVQLYKIKKGEKT